MSLNTTPRTWVAAEIVTATEMNTEVRDAFTGIQAAWTSYTPALTAPTTNPTLGTGSSAAGASLRVGKSVTGTADIVFGSSGFVAGSGVYEISLPVAANAASVAVGSIAGGGTYIDVSPLTVYPVTLRFQSTTTARLLYQGATTGLSNAAPVTPAINDRIHIEFDYQAA